jgi:hypothetical protein
MIISEIFNTQAIAAYFTEAQSNKIPFLGEAFFPNKKKMGIDLKWLKAHKGLGVALKPSNLDAIPTIRPRGQANMTKEQMPLFRESMIVKEHDLMELSRIADINDPFLQPVIDSMYDDVTTLVDGAEISAERMRMNLLAPANGDMQIVVPMADNTMMSYNYDEDGTWKAKNYLELTGADTWDNPTSKPLNDVRKAVQYLASVGVTATSILGNSTTFDYLLENEQIKNALISVTGQAINFVDESTVEEVLRRKMRLDWIPYDKMFEDYDGTQKKFYPDNYITILGSGQLGNTWRGTTPEELTTIGNFMNVPQAPVDITVLDNGIAVAIQNEYKPSFTVTTTASQIVLPSFEGMDTIFVIKVK